VKKGIAFLFFLIFFSALTCSSALTTVAADSGKKIDPCALLTKAEIEAAVGKPVGDSKPGANQNPAVGVSCTFTIASFGSFNLLIKPLSSYETPAKIKAAFQKRNTKMAAAPGVGADAFFLFPGYGMVQLNAFKGGKYALITLLIPDAKEDAAKAPAEKLMKLVLTRI